MTIHLKRLLETILEEYALPWDGHHGIAHWARVLENGMRLAEVTGANALQQVRFALEDNPDLLIRINAHQDAALREVLPLIAEFEASGARDVVLVVTPPGPIR